MALGSLLLLFALLMLVAWFVVQPLLRLDADDDLPDLAVSHWTAERERALAALAELDADQAMGKVPEDLYASQRADLLALGAAALQALEKLQKPAKPGHKPAKSDDLEAQIAAYKAKRNRTRGTR